MHEQLLLVQNRVILDTCGRNLETFFKIPVIDNYKYLYVIIFITNKKTEKIKDYLLIFCSQLVR